MKEQFSDDYFFIKEVIHYLRNGNKSQQTEYRDKLLNRYEKYIKAVIAKGIKFEYELKDDVFNQLCMKLFDPKELEKYRGDASFMTFIYPRIMEAISNVMTPSEEERKDKKNRKRKIKKAGEQEVDRPLGYSHQESVANILRENLETPYPTRQHSQEYLLVIKELRLKLDHVIAITILKMSQIHPKDIRIFVMSLCDYSWDEIGECVGIDAKSASKRYIRSGGILEKVTESFKNTLWENYKIDLKTVSVNFNDLLDVE